jgi:excisionase family DNA binding protein
MNLLLTKEAAAILRISEDHCRRLLRTGELKGYREGKRGGYRIQAAEIERYIAKKLKDGAE